MLYHPTPGEIDAVISRGIAKTPTLTSRFLRASVILTTGALTYRGNSWHCESQSHPNEVHAVDFHGCSCLDYLSEGAKVHGVPYCKHKLALLALNEIAGNQIAARCVGTYRGRADFGRLRGAANAGLLLTDPGNGRPPVVATVTDCDDHIPTSVCRTRWTPRGHRPADEAQLAKLLTWLDDALRLPPVIEAEMLFRRGKADGLPDTDAAALADEVLIARYTPADW